MGASSSGAVVVDASVWVSRYVNQDVNHTVSYLWLRRHFTAGCIAIGPMILLAELAGPIARRTGDVGLAHNAYRQVLRVPNFRIVPIDRQLGLLTAKLAADLSMRGADAVYVALAQSLNVPLVTLDEQQRDRAARLVSAISPTAL